MTGALIEGEAIDDKKTWEAVSDINFCDHILCGNYYYELYVPLF